MQTFHTFLADTPVLVQYQLLDKGKVQVVSIRTANANLHQAIGPEEQLDTGVAGGLRHIRLSDRGAAFAEFASLIERHLAAATPATPPEATPPEQGLTDAQSADEP